MKRFLYLLLVAALILSFCSCGNNEESDVTGNQLEETESNINYTMKLAYSRNDSLNPFYGKTVINNQIDTLVYDGLVKLDSSYKPKPEIADSFVVNNNMVTVVLGDSVFSDGTSITANDIIDSFTRAKISDVYAGRLSNVVSCSAGDINSVVFTLENKDPYAASCLDFPITKFNSDLNMPIGSGRYYFTTIGETVYLVVNKYKTDFNPAIRVIKLESINENESIESSLVIGNTSFCYEDLSDGIYERTDARNIDVGINSLVYLGINSSSEFFSDSNLRQAVSYALDRSEIVSTAFRSHARETSTPFNPDWYEVKDGTYSVEKNIEKARQLIEESSFDLDTGEVTLMYNAENQFKKEMAELVKGYLDEIGFHIRLKPYNSQEFIYDLKSDSYDLYIGEVKLTGNMDLTPILTGQASYGVNEESPGIVRYQSFLDGSCALMDFINSFSDDMPIVPVCYRNAICLFTKSMRSSFNCCDSDVFYDIESWSLK